MMRKMMRRDNMAVFERRALKLAAPAAWLGWF